MRKHRQKYNSRASQSASASANARWSKECGVLGTQKARAAAFKRFERTVDPEGKLPQSEGAKRSRRAERAHMQRISLLSATARRKNRSGHPAEEER